LISKYSKIDILDIKGQVIMKTSVELDDQKVKMAKDLAHVSTLRELLDRALDAFIAETRRKNMASLLGTDFFDGHLAAMRERLGRNRR
jgi:hypothetical protein